VDQLPQTLLLRKEVRRLATVSLRPNESQDQLLKRFRKKVAKSGILSTVRRKRWFVSKSELRRIQKKKAIRRIKRRQITEPE
jgi:small subunit ribosomal protein S21